jgi:hypothetical protein
MSNSSRHYPDPYRSDTLGRLAGGRLWLKAIIMGICLIALGRMLIGMRQAAVTGNTDTAKIAESQRLGVQAVPSAKSASLDSISEFNKRHYASEVAETSK